MSRRPLSLAVAVALLFAVSSLAPTAFAVDIIWDGGDGNWNDDPLINGIPGKWNGGQASFDIFGGHYDGWEAGRGAIGSHIFIPSGNVNYDTNTWKDFRFIPKAPENEDASLNVGGGPGSPATLSMDVSFDLGADIDGYWTQFNGGTFNLDNGTFRRTHTPASGGQPSSGGLMQFGGIRGYPNATINVNLTNGGRIENDGQMTFGWYLRGDEAVGRTIHFTIDDGHIDLTGSNKFDHLGGVTGGAGNADLSIHYGWDSVADAPAGEDYAINFIGPGTITVDEGGILVVRQTAFTNQPDPGAFDLETVTTPRSYQHLWDIGILQANGLSGPDGANFDDFFMVDNNVGDVDYRLISLVGMVPGDYDGNGSNGPEDYALWKATFGSTENLDADGDGNGQIGAGDYPVWRNNLGAVAGAGATIPEPTSVLLFVTPLAWLFCLRRRSRRG